MRKGAKKRKPRASKLDAFKPVIQELVVKKDLTAIRVLREIRALGYQGGYSVLKEYARSIRRRSRRRPHLRFETDKGRQGQVDLSDYTVDFRGQATEVVCFSMVFGYSRWQFIRFTLAANAHSVCHSHVLAFEKAGGAPHEMLYDRMKQVVLESYADHVVFHPLFAALVRHYGFKAIPLAPGYKEGKGKVENAFKFVFSDFLQGSTFHDLEDLNRKAEAWLRDVAWVRKHGTTQERPIDRMDEERPYLIPLPARPFVAARIEERLVGYDFCVAWDTNRYSVSPTFVGRSVQAMALDGILDIYLEGEIIARHQLRQTRHRRYILPEHESEFRQHSTSRHVLQEQFLRLGEIAQTFRRRARQGAWRRRRLSHLGDPEACGSGRHAARPGSHAPCRPLRRLQPHLGGAYRARQASGTAARLELSFRVAAPKCCRVSESVRLSAALDRALRAAAERKSAQTGKKVRRSNTMASEERDQLLSNLRRLQLRHAANRIDDLLREAAQLKLGHLGFLARVAETEVLGRTETATNRRIQEADFPQPWRIEDYDFKEQPSLDRKVILDLAELGLPRPVRSQSFSLALRASARAISRSASACALAPPAIASATSAPTTCSRTSGPPWPTRLSTTCSRITAVLTC